MIKSQHEAQIAALAEVLEKDASHYGGVQISQRNDGIIGVSLMNGAGKMERHTYVMIDGDTKEVHSASEEPQD